MAATLWCSDLVMVIFVELLDQFRIILLVSLILEGECPADPITSLETRESISQDVDLLGLRIWSELLTRFSIYLFGQPRALAVEIGHTRAAFGPLFISA